MLQNCSKYVTVIKSGSTLIASYNQPLSLRLPYTFDCDMRNGSCFENWLTGMQISTEIHNPQNKRGNKHYRANSDNIHGGEEDFHNGGQREREEDGDQGTQILGHQEK